jgi:hypothetical protein
MGEERRGGEGLGKGREERGAMMCVMGYISTHIHLPYNKIPVKQVSRG